MADESGTGGVSALALTSTADGVTGAITISSTISSLSLTISAAGIAEVIGTSDISVLAPEILGEGLTGFAGEAYLTTRYTLVEGGGQSDNVVALEPTVEGEGVAGHITFDNVVNADAPVISGIGATGYVGAGDVDVSAPIIFAHEGSYGSVAIAEPDVVGEGVSGVVGLCSIAADKPIVSGSFSNYETGVGVISALQRDIVAEGVTQNLISGYVSATAVSVNATGVAGSVGTADFSVPLVSVSASGHSSITGIANIVIPAAIVSANGIQELAVPYVSGIAVNTRIRAVSQYVGMNVRDFCTISGTILAISDNGIVALTGTSDDATAIDVDVLSGVTDFNSTNIKKIIAGYVSMKASGDLSLSLISDGGDEREYELRTRSENLHVGKIRFGLGVRGRHWQWRLRNNGNSFEINRISFDTESTDRRV